MKKSFVLILAMSCGAFAFAGGFDEVVLVENNVSPPLREVKQLPSIDFTQLRYEADKEYVSTLLTEEANYVPMASMLKAVIVKLWRVSSKAWLKPAANGPPKNSVTAIWLRPDAERWRLCPEYVFTGRATFTKT